MLILGAHELGHYFAARYHKVPVTLPYFIPLPPPFSLFGTLGAFIQLKAPIKSRRALLDVGAAGPLAGFVFALPILIYGLATSPVGPIGPLPADGVILLEGNSILYALTKFMIFGQFLPNGNLDVQLNVQNLTDKRYFNTTYFRHYAIPAPGRVAFVNLNLKF